MILVDVAGCERVEPPSRVVDVGDLALGALLGLLVDGDPVDCLVAG